ncbi:hypothetical protein [Terrabacter carboxydivorans]|uniref:Peptide chain release factor 1 n=1 Tax=Terrabacter carboxydivorans TaxID=619730 RepID=A0ABP5YUW7_9MICO
MNTQPSTGTASTPWDDLDPGSAESLQRLSETDGPCVSVYLPTSVQGPDVRLGPSRLRTLVRQAARDLSEAGVEDRVAAELLAQLRDLEGDDDFWQGRAPGLGLFVAPGVAMRARLPVAPDEQVVVGTAFRLHPLIPLVTPSGGFLVLALSQNRVRLLHGTREAASELELGQIPSSMRAAIPQEETERHGQSHSSGLTGGRREQQVHGQGNEADYDKAALERFFRAVDEPLTQRFGRRGEPLVLACVGYYLPIYRQVSRYPALVHRAVEGNPEHRSAADLHAAAWDLVASDIAAREQVLQDRFREADGTGLTASDPEQLLTAARDGRVDTLFIAPDPAPNGSPPAPPDHDGLIDSAVRETLRHGGRCVPLAVLPAPGRAAALLRY